jgi:hypothetical protein
MKDKEYQPQRRVAEKILTASIAAKKHEQRKALLGFLICAFLRVFRQKIIFSLLLRG